MRNTRQRDTPFELAVRRRVHARGLRYLVDHSIAGVTRARPDLVFRGARVAVFLDGCFWHSCPIHGTRPRRNEAWWAAKLAANRERDARHRAELTAAGWTALRFFAHEDPGAVADEIERAVGGAATSVKSGHMEAAASRV